MFLLPQLTHFLRGAQLAALSFCSGGFELSIPNQPSHIIRPLTEADLPTLVAYHAALHAAEPYNPTRSLAYLTTWFNQPRDFWAIPVALATQPDGSEGEIIGITGVAHSGDDLASWGSLSVLPAYRVTLAADLYERAEAIALEQQLANLTFTPRQQNVWLQDFVLERGYQFSRYFWNLRLPAAASLPPMQLPDGYTLRTYVRGQDEALWQRLDSEVFASGFGQHTLSAAEIEQMLNDPTHEMAGFFFAEQEGVAVGYCETLVFTNEDNPALGGDGMIANLGVLAAHRRVGLGRALLLAGCHYLRQRGCSAIDLHVDGENATAVRLYESIGFQQHETTLAMIKNFKEAN